LASLKGEWMVFERKVIEQTIDSYTNISAYFASIRFFYEVVSARLAAGEYGPSLVSMQGTELLSSSNSHRLSDPLNTGNVEPGACPAYIWFPNWLGCFYTVSAPFSEKAPSGSQSSAREVVAFVWIWIGRDDAYVADAAEPECWTGVAEVDTHSSAGPMVVEKIWRFFRVEWTTQSDVEDWLTGDFHKNDIGCDLEGRWHLRRTALSELSNYYAVEKLIIQPLCTKVGQARH
jgi:hypothetical protein